LKRGLRTEARLVGAVAILVSAMLVAWSYIEYHGFPPLSYRGRRDVAREALFEKIDVSVLVKRGTIKAWIDGGGAYDSKLAGLLIKDPIDTYLNLNSLIVSEEGMTLFSGNPDRYPVGVSSLTPDFWVRLDPNKPIEAKDHDGNRHFVRAVGTGSLSGEPFRVLVIAPSEVLDKTLNSDQSALIVLSLSFLLIGILLAFWLAHDIVRPLKSLRDAVAAYSADEIPVLPRNTGGDIGLILDAFADLMSKMGSWRYELEKEVKARTLELAIRGAVDHSLANSIDDDVAYCAALEKIVDHLEDAGGLFSWFDGRGKPCAVIAGGSSLIHIDPSDELLIDVAVEASEGPFNGLGIELPYSLAVRLTVGDEAIGTIILGRYDRSFLPEEKSFIIKVVGDFSPLVQERGRRAKQEVIRVDAEHLLKRSEQRLRTFFEESRDMIYTVNTDDVIASINAAGLTLLGSADRFDVVGRKFSDFVLSVQDREVCLERIHEAGFVNDYEIILKKIDGSAVFCLETSQAVKAKDGSILEIQGIIKDITDRIAKERELWQTNLELADANSKLKDTQMLVVQREKLASIGQLAAGIAHEINNPLAFLKSNHQILLDFLARMRDAWQEASVADPAQHGHIAEGHDLDYVFSEIPALVEESDEGYRRIMDIVKNLKSFARVDTNADFGNYDLDAGIASTLVVARNEIKYVADVELKLGRLPPIEASGGEVNQVLLNILVNAAQAIEGQKRHEKGLILVETWIEGDRAICEISDDGPGIPGIMNLIIFDPFFTTKDPGKGTGLGLSISYDIIVNKHGGRLTVGESMLGGALFRIELPVRRIEPNPSLS